MEESGRRSEPFEDISSAEDGELFCQPCSREYDWVVAMGYCQNCNEYLCTVCLKVHHKQSATKHHVILEGEQMPKSALLKACAEPCSELCLKHSNEILKFYCPSHDTIGCSDCMVLDHKPCNVERIQEISRDYFRGHEHRQLIEKVQALLKNIDEIRSSIDVAAQDVSSSYTQAVADIKAFRKEINEYLDRVQAQILAEVNKRKQKEEMIIFNMTVEYQSLQKEIERFDEKIQQQSNKASALFVAAKQMKARMTSFESTIYNMDTDSKIKQYKFKPTSDMIHVLSSQCPLGKLTETIEQRSSRKNMFDMEVMFAGEIQVKTTEDAENCFIRSSALISPSHMVLADYDNSCLKIVNVELGKLSSRYKMTSEPWDVAVVSRDLIAVTLPKQNRIQFMSVSEQYTLTKSHDIKVKDKVRNIACQNDNLIIGYQDNRLEIRTKTGEVMKTISSPDLTWITSIATAPDSKTFYVANIEFNGEQTAIYKFDSDGKLFATYKDKTRPNVQGLTVTPDGTVLACKYAEKGGIYLLSPDCKKIKEILLENEHVKYPYSVSFCHETNKLLLNSVPGFLKSVPGNQNVLKMFQLK